MIERMLAHDVDKDLAAVSLESTRAIFARSLVSSQPLSAGTALTPDHLAMKKPGTGIPASRIDAVLGRRLRRNLAADELLHESDLEQVEP
jgi:N-acetylneuraminate synthase